MVTKKQWAIWGLVLGAIAGALWILTGLSMAIEGGFLGSAFDGFTGTVSWLDDALGATKYIVSGIIIAVIGVLTLLISIGRLGINYVFIGVILIIFAIIAAGIPGFLALVGGIFYIIAGTK